MQHSRGQYEQHNEDRKCMPHQKQLDSHRGWTVARKLIFLFQEILKFIRANSGTYPSCGPLASSGTKRPWFPGAPYELCGGRSDQQKKSTCLASGRGRNPSSLESQPPLQPKPEVHSTESGHFRFDTTTCKTHRTSRLPCAPKMGVS